MCYLLPIWLYSWFQTNPHPPDVTLASNIPFSLSCSGPKPSNYSEFSLSLTSNIQSINKFGQLYLQDKSWIWPLLPSFPHLSLDHWASILTDLILPAHSIPLNNQSALWKRKLRRCLSPLSQQPWTIRSPLTFPILSLSLSCPFAVLSYTCWSWNRPRFTHSRALQLLSLCLPPDPCGSLFRSQLKCHFLRVALWSHYQK